jgi:CRP-like cAMP-binding protein
MSINEEVDRLRRIPLFANVDATKLKLLAFASERLTFPPETDLFRQGDVADAAYLIMEGSADVLIELPDGQLPVAKIGRDELVGEIGILCDVPRTATSSARSPCCAASPIRRPSRPSPGSRRSRSPRNCSSRW